MIKLTPFQQDAMDYSKHISLTANAGSGKTFVLAKRFLNVVLNEEINLREIVAITFTDKAAGELNKKIAAEIEEKFASATDSNEIKKLISIRRQLVSANISTIHSFCIEILKEFSPEAGLDANFIPIDQYVSNELIEFCVEEIVDGRLTDEKDDEVKELVRLLGSKTQLVNELLRLVNSRKNVFEFEASVSSLSEEEIADLYRELFQNKFSLLFETEFSRIISFIQKINEVVIDSDSGNEIADGIEKILEQIKSENDLIKLLAVIQNIAVLMLTKTNTILKQKYLKGELGIGLEFEISETENFFKTIKDFYFDEITAHSELALSVFTKKILILFRAVVDLYDEQKRLKGWLDFEDILLKTKNILGNSEVQKYLSGQYKYIMIDEYQDTNKLQYQIFMPLLNELKSGNLFIVGDEKQSIYMFRDADIKLFTKTIEKFKNADAGSEILQLPHSFRLSPAIAAFTNILFGRLFANPNIEFNEVEYSDLICAKPEDTPGSIEFLFTGQEENDIAESELISRKILYLLGEKELEIQPKDIAVLCRKRKSFEELEIALSQHRIPFSVVGGKGYFQKQIIADFFNYLTFLITPDNDTSLVGILRAPFFMISDTELFNISQQKGSSFFAKLKNAAKITTELQKPAGLLNNQITLAKTSDINFLLRNIIERTNYLPVISARQNYTQEIANMEKLINLAGKFEGQGFSSLFDFVDFLKNSIENLDDEGQASSGEDENAVKIMTIHQAKGLEFKAVFLYRCNDTGDKDTIKAKSVSFDREFGMLTKVPVNGDYFNEYKSPPIAALYNYVSKRKNTAELKRLLYVAVTRAIQHLFISGTVTGNSFKSGSFLDLISSGLNSSLVDEESLKLGTALKFMKLEQNEYMFFDLDFQIEMPVIKFIEEVKNILPGSESRLPKIMDVFDSDVQDSESEEIISATKVAVYTQCPVKYYLTYELGYTKINKLFGKNIFADLRRSEFNLKEENEFAGFGDVRGKIIHRILELNLRETGFEDELDKLVEAERLFFENKNELTEKFKAEITADLNKLFQSSSFKEIISFPEFKNEFEIYTKLEDFYLYGIIDRLIFEEDKIIIIDYKTENISEKDLPERIQKYMTQLLFYAVLANSHFKDKRIELRLLFVKQPELATVKKLGKNEMNDFRKEIIKIVSEIRNEKFMPNLSHCRQCHFADKNDRCVRAVD